MAGALVVRHAVTAPPSEPACPPRVRRGIGWSTRHDLAVAANAPTVQDESELVQLLTPEGERVPSPDYDRLIADVTDDDIRSLYRDLVLARRVDTEAVALQRHGELGLWASLLGQAGAQVGSGRALRPQDHVFPTYREHG